MLLNLGCELAQGYFIARPMAARDLPGWIENFQISPEWKYAGQRAIPVRIVHENNQDIKFPLFRACIVQR